MCKITVFTPLYNRGYCLERLSKSLCEQTYKDFEWIVINDGSTDNSHELMQTYLNENMLHIKYRYVENAGKHVAINLGVSIADGELFFIVDSDDYLPDNSLERIVYWESTIIEKANYAGVAGCRGSNKEEIIGDTFQGEYIDATVIERDKNNIIGDKAEVFYTAILRKYPFPYFEGEKFISESAVWLKIAKDGYKIRWFNEITYIGEYLGDGLTAKGNLLFQNNPRGFLYTTQLEMQCYESDYIKKAKLCVGYYLTMKKQNRSMIACAKDLNISVVQLFILNCIYALIHVLKR